MWGHSAPGLAAIELRCVWPAAGNTGASTHAASQRHEAAGPLSAIAISCSHSSIGQILTEHTVNQVL